ncbi:hypothetical protein PAGU1579_10320 [Veillonella tobetsuensis]|uniref:Uncharacterized protein n=1 Tax=Veillonella tobetsuensis TaxID=1110546 RepID=A0A480B6N4_9FIRM|nr:hypothetical protein PAGU1579_10320 [Veillonella tobetsuensis]
MVNVGDNRYISKIFANHKILPLIPLVYSISYNACESRYIGIFPKLATLNYNAVYRKKSKQAPILIMAISTFNYTFDSS